MGARIDQARTLAAVAGMNYVLGAGIVGGALLGNRRRFSNLSVPASVDLAFALSGVSLNVVGDAHLRSPRPAVYAFNHQSNLDPLVVVKLVRSDFTSTGKAEVRKDPAAVLAAVAIDAVLIDRADSDAARAALDRAAERLRGGESVLIAPEGTRNRGREPGDYKTGVVHLALAGRAPIVPIVLRNTGDLMARRTITPGTVDVCVLAPVLTEDWKASDAREHARELRELMAGTIADWPV